MTRDEFERVAQEVFDGLPERFRSAVENVHIVVEERDDAYRRRAAGVRHGSVLPGLYAGVPAPKRGVDYGAYPVLPDRITLFQHNIESAATPENTVQQLIREVLLHDIGHYFGMSEKEIRKAGY